MHDDSESHDYFYPMLLLCLIVLLLAGGGGGFMLYRIKLQEQLRATEAAYAELEARRAAEVAANRAAETLQRLEFKNLDGTWILTSAEQDGVKLTEDQIKTGRLVMNGAEHVITIGEESIKGSHTVDANKTPHTIDSTDSDGPNKGMTRLGVYELTGDKFTVGLAAPGQPRPKNLQEATRVRVWQRDKKLP